MKKGTFNFLGRKNQSLFDTGVKFKEMDNVELVLDSSTIPESGTAKVRSRPGVRHYISTGDNGLGFAVPTPTVPVLPSHNGLHTNGSVFGDRFSNGSGISVPDMVEGEILVPPPPSMAPPPPPPKQFIPPTPYFLGDLNGADLAALQPPSMPPPKPPSLAPSLEDKDLTHLKPPPMAPPKPPINSFKGSTSSLPISTPPPARVPNLSECPNSAPPQPPSEKKQKYLKTPPPKPIRLSSMGSLDALEPQAPAPASLVKSQDPSSFNPQTKAKTYVPKTSILSGYSDHDTRPKQMLHLEDSGSVNSAMVPIQVNGKVPTVALPSKPVGANSAGAQLEKGEIKENSQAKLPLPTSQSQPPGVKTVATQQEINKPVKVPPEVSPKLRKDLVGQSILDGNQWKTQQSPSQNRKYSPLIDRKLRNLRGSEYSGTREGPAASPFALLMAAKEREKHRSSLSCENSSRKNEEPCASIQPSDSNPKSFIVTPRPTSSPSLSPQGIENRPKSVVPLEPIRTQTSEQHMSITLGGNNTAATKPTATSTPAISSDEKKSVVRGPTATEGLPKNRELLMPVLPPPPEFANFEDSDEFMESPPNSPAPDPAAKAPLRSVGTAPSVQAPPPSPKKALLPNVGRTPSVQAPPPSQKPPPPPQLPPPDTDSRTSLPLQTKSKVPPTQPPSSLSASQATLLSILQKKMLEMDHKMAPMKETEAHSDDWGSTLSDEEATIPVASKATPQNKNYTLPNKTSLDMRELETKVAKKYQDTSSSMGATSNGPKSKHQYGMTFTVRPGTKQPITLVSKGDST